MFRQEPTMRARTQARLVASKAKLEAQLARHFIICTPTRRIQFPPTHTSNMHTDHSILHHTRTRTQVKSMDNALKDYEDLMGDAKKKNVDARRESEGETR